MVAQMPAMRALGGGVLYIEPANYTRVKLTPDKWHGIDLLLKQQAYVSDVLPWNGQRTDYNLNDFRAMMSKAVSRGKSKDVCLSDWVLDTHGVQRSERDRQWLTVEPLKIAPVVISRAGAGRESRHRYHNYQFPWNRVVEKYSDAAVFIGTEPEHREFCDVFGNVPWHPTADLFEAARVIAGCDLFVGNQSCPHMIAQGLFKNIVLEVWPQGPNCCFHRKGVIHGWDNKVVLPDLVFSDDPPKIMSETAKFKHLVQQYCTGNGVDLGSAGDPVVPHAIQVDLPELEYRRYNTTRPAAVIQWRGTAEDLPFKDNTLDWLSSSHLLEDFKDWSPLLNEWHRVLKRSGYMIISVPDHERFRAYVRRGREAGVNCENCSHRHEGKIGEVASYFPTYETLYDNFVNGDPNEYSLLYVGRKR